MHHHEFKAWRDRMGYTQQQAAEVLDISAASVANYESGVRREDGRSVVIPILVEVACQAAEMKTHRARERAHRKKEVLGLIQTKLPTNGQRQITAAALREVLSEIVEASFSD